MNLFNKYIFKYGAIYILMLVIMQLTQTLFPSFYIVSNESGSVTQTSLFALYQAQFFALIPALFVLIDLRKRSKTAFFIPLLTILHLEAGLLFFGFATFCNIILTNNEQG